MKFQSIYIKLSDCFVQLGATKFGGSNRLSFGEKQIKFLQLQAKFRQTARAELQSGGLRGGQKTPGSKAKRKT